MAGAVVNKAKNATGAMLIIIRRISHKGSRATKYFFLHLEALWENLLRHNKLNLTKK